MIKQMAGQVTSLLRSQCSFERTVFILGHMRCGSTALSNVLCSHPEISGYGEAHIRYDGPHALGILSLNQLRRKALRREARYLFDKILHSRYDADACPEFYDSRAIFLLREPSATVHSIRNLFRVVGSGEYATDAQAADYYEVRLTGMMAAWEKFPAARRLGFTHAQLIADTEAALTAISRLLEIDPPLVNRYTPPSHEMPRGAGDPLESHRHQRIVRQSAAALPVHGVRALDIPESRVDQLKKLFSDASRIVTQL